MGSVPGPKYILSTTITPAAALWHFVHFCSRLCAYTRTWTETAQKQVASANELAPNIA